MGSLLKLGVKTCMMFMANQLSYLFKEFIVNLLKQVEKYLVRESVLCAQFQVVSVSKKKNC